jgi:dihydroorotate dehydrogenase
MYQIIRPFLFHMETERAHAFTLNLLRLAGAIPPIRGLLSLIYNAHEKPVQAFGLTFKNQLGLAAGYDKDGLGIRGLSALGFGHLEIGTVTPRPQPGNPSPRIFRLTEDEAVINRLGFPSRGSQFLQMQLNPALRVKLVQRQTGSGADNPTYAKLTSSILGVNIGKNKDTPNEEAVFDYLELLQNFAPYADYLTVNVSSPNTQGLRDLQVRNALESLLSHIHQQRSLEEKKLEKRVPILVKLSPDLSETQLDDAIDAILRTRMDGVIVTNTTLSRDRLKSAHQKETGGLSGKPLSTKSEAALAQTIKHINGQIPVISVGGVMTPADAKRRLEMGATLVQIYTGMIYHGPAFARDILRSL